MGLQFFLKFYNTCLTKGCTRTRICSFSHRSSYINSLMWPLLNLVVTKLVSCSFFTLYTSKRIWLQKFLIRGAGTLSWHDLKKRRIQSNYHLNWWTLRVSLAIKHKIILQKEKKMLDLWADEFLNYWLILDIMPSMWKFYILLCILIIDQVMDVFC